MFADAILNRLEFYSQEHKAYTLITRFKINETRLFFTTIPRFVDMHGNCKGNNIHHSKMLLHKPTS